MAEFNKRYLKEVQIIVNAILEKEEEPFSTDEIAERVYRYHEYLLENILNI